MSDLNPNEIREMRREARKKAQGYPDHLVPIPVEHWAENHAENLVGVWHSNKYIVMLYAMNDGVSMLAISRYEIGEDGQVKNNLTWREMWNIKNEVGFDENWGVEIYPPVDQRHTFSGMRVMMIPPVPPAYAFKRGEGLWSEDGDDEPNNIVHSGIVPVQQDSTIITEP